jgi:hypothetical protein
VTDLTALDAANQALQSSPTVAKATKDYGAAATAAIHALAGGPATPPAGSWQVAPPQDPVTTIVNPAGVGVNLYNASSPKLVTDTVIHGGGDSAFLIQPGAPGRTLQRCEAYDVALGNAVTYGKHAIYAKAANLTVLDFYATASKYAANGLSVRYPGFLGQRCQLDGFPIPLAVFADDQTAGTVTWRQIRGAFTNVGVWLDVDEAAKMVYDVTLDRVDLTGPGTKFLNASAAFASTVQIRACTLNGKPVTSANVGGVPAGQLHIS